MDRVRLFASARAARATWPIFARASGADLALKYNLRGQIGCRCWCDGMMDGDHLRRDGLQRCFPKEQQRNQR
jgi:hypothetical protein